MTKPEAVIFDFDNTLCDVSSIWHMVAEGVRTRNFDDYHEASRKCPPIPTTLWALRKATAEGYHVFVVTARQEKYRHTTIEWMSNHVLSCDAVFMRKDGDFRDDVTVKRELLQEIQKDFRVIHAWEDRPEIVELWKTEGIPVTVVPGWED